MNTPQFDTHQLEVEACSAILAPSNRNRLDEWLDLAAPADFNDPALGEVWEVATRLHAEGKRVTRTGVTRLLQTPGAQNRAQNLTAVITPATVPATLTELRDTAQRRRIALALTDSMGHAVGAESPDDALQAILGTITGLMEAVEPDDVVSIESALVEWEKKINQRDENSRIIPTPWASLNVKLAGGLHPGRTYIFGARPGVGKSLSGVNICTYAAHKGHPAAIFSAEMPTFEVTSRIVAASTGTNYGAIVKRDIDADDDQQIRQWINHIRQSGMPLYLADKPGMTVESIMSQARALKRRSGLDVIFVDYLQLIKESDSRVSRERQVAHISWSLKQLAKELDIAVVIAAQLNRNSAQENTPPQLNELRESGSIEQDADVVILIDKVMIENQFQGEVMFYIRKNRTGELCEIPLAFRGHVARIDNINNNF